MRSILLLFLGSLFISVSANAQRRAALKTKIDEIAARILPSVDKDEFFIKSGKSYIEEEDYQLIKNIVMTNGFPTISMVGKESSHQFWMLVQLCDNDPRMQMAISKHMSFMMRSGDVIKEDLAMLTDRARMNKSLPQLYGTQFVISEEGTVLIYQTHNMDNIDARRKALGLTTFREYRDNIAPSISEKEKLAETSEYDYSEDQ